MAYGAILGQTPTVDVDAFTKEQTLTTATAALYGLTSSAVPDDVLAWIGKYAQHWWDAYEYSFEQKSTAVNNIIPLYNNYYSGSVTLKYSTAVQIGSDGKLALKSPSSKLLNVDNIFTTETQNLFKGKYVSGVPDRESDVFLLSTTEKPFGGSGSGVGGYIQQGSASLVEAIFVIGNYVKSVTSNDESEYPKSGVQNGYYYQYIGVPFENLPKVPKIATGSYTGTGTYGSSNPNSLAFEFKPKIVVIEDSFGSAGGYVWINEANSGISTYSSNCVLNWEANSLKWYNGSSAISQLNDSGVKYLYFILG